MKLFFSVLLIFFSFLIFGQTGIKGFTRSDSGELLPFSTVYIKGTTNGTASNSEGEFFLKTPSGTHIIVAQYVGYKVVEKQITLNENQTIRIDFSLQEQTLQLNEVVVTAGDENPAYRVIRETINKRKFYRDEVTAFKADAYLKGLFRLDKRPDKILGQVITIDTGIIYLSESVSEYFFELPDKVYEKMISSKISGDEQGFSFNQASDFNINPYKKFIDLNMERDFVSPISPQAFLFYEYEWLGFFEENGKYINKIKVIPKRSTDPVFEGVINIVEDEWRFHTIDLLVIKARGLEFIDSLKIHQVFAPSQHEIWMPVSQKLSFTFGFFGFKGSGYYIGLFSNYEVQPNYDVYKKENLYEEKFETKQEKDLFQDTDFSAEVLLVEKGSNERDSTYWQDVRPIPLTEMEVQDYQIGDSIRVVKESIPYKDSVDHETNKPTPGNIFLTGYTHSNSIEEKYWSLPNAISIFQFNTVEGFVPEIKPTITKRTDGRTKYWIRPAFRYGFSNERFNAKLEASYYKLNDTFTAFYAGGGRYISQFDESESFSPFINSLVTLIGGENYLKIFEKSFGYVRFRQEIKNGVFLTTGIEYASRDTLTNTTDYTWAQDEKTNFTSNQPLNAELVKTGFATNQALVFRATFRFRIKQKYATRPDQKLIYPSEYPEIFFTYKKGINTLGSDVNFDFVQIRIKDDVSIGLAGTSTYTIAAGAFLNDDELTFVDYKHFSGNQTLLRQNGNTTDDALNFQILPFYRFSTSKPYLEVHYEHHFNEFIFNKIPLIKKLNLQAVASVNYLTTETIGNYVELGAGIEHIFKFMRVDYYWAFKNSDLFGSGFRVGIGF